MHIGMVQSKDFLCVCVCMCACDIIYLQVYFPIFNVNCCVSDTSYASLLKLLATSFIPIALWLTSHEKKKIQLCLTYVQIRYFSPPNFKCFPVFMDVWDARGFAWSPHTFSPLWEPVEKLFFFLLDCSETVIYTDSHWIFLQIKQSLVQNKRQRFGSEFSIVNKYGLVVNEDWKWNWRWNLKMTGRFPIRQDGWSFSRQ